MDERKRTMRKWLDRKRTMRYLEWYVNRTMINESIGSIGRAWR